MSGVIDGLASELIGLRVAEVPSVVTVEHTVRVRRAAAHREDVVREASAIVADIVQAGALVLIFFPAWYKRVSLLRFVVGGGEVS